MTILKNFPGKIKYVLQQIQYCTIQYNNAVYIRNTYQE